MEEEEVDEAKNLSVSPPPMTMRLGTISPLSQTNQPTYYPTNLSPPPPGATTINYSGLTVIE